jgi:fibronectin type III domain protein
MRKWFGAVRSRPAWPVPHVTPRLSVRRWAPRWWTRAAIVLVAVALPLAGLSATAASASTSIAYVQGAAQVGGSPATTQTLTFSKPVAAGDLLVGWFAQYNSPGHVSVSDNVNGSWTRSVSETFSSGGGDIALFFLSNSAAAPNGLTITVSTSSATYLQSSAAEYSGVATTNSLDQAALNSGFGTSVSTGQTASVAAGELVYSALTTGGNPGSVTPGSTQNVTFTARASTSSGTAYEQDVTSAAAGAQQGTATLGNATDWYAVAATFVPSGGGSGGGGSGGSTATFQQGAAFASGTRATSQTFTLSRPVHAGDLLVGWFAQYNVSGQVAVSDNLNGAWARAPGSLTFQSDTGDIAMYYLPDSKASASGLTITVSAPTPAYLQGTAAEYSGVAVAGPLDQLASARGVGTAVNTGSTASVASGELVYSAIVTGSGPGGVTPGTGYTVRAQTSSGSSYEQDILSSTAGPQTGTATLGTSADWYAVDATFRVNPNDTSPPGPPSGLNELSAAASRVALTWSPGSGDLTGYAISRNGTVIGTTAASQTTYLDMTVAPGTQYTYTVAAFNGSGLMSSPTNSVVVTTPVTSPSFVQGTAASPGSRATSLTLTLSQPVAAGDLLVGWFGQYNAPGQVQVSDNVNGAWTRGPSETFTSGTGDIALEYVANAKAAPNGITITVKASSAAYLQEAIADFRGVATVAPLVTAVVGHGSTTAISMGPTASVPANDLVIGATITAGQPGSILPGTSQGVPYVVDVQNGSASSTLEDILASAAGPQTATATLGAASTSYTVVAVFNP